MRLIAGPLRFDGLYVSSSRIRRKVASVWPTCFEPTCSVISAGSAKPFTTFCTRFGGPFGSSLGVCSTMSHITCAISSQIGVAYGIWASGSLPCCASLS